MSAREPTTAERKAAEAVQKYRKEFPEIAKLWREPLAPDKDAPQHKGGKRAQRRAAVRGRK